MFHVGGMYMGGFHVLWWLFWVALIGVLLFIGFGRLGMRRHPRRETPLEVLRRRLASGEITPKEYEERRVLLERDGASKL